MIKRIKSSLYLKLLSAFLLIGIIPYLIITIYFFYLGKENLLNQKLQTYKFQAIQSKALLESKLNHLQEEVEFLSKLELFDDMISNDIDHRISRLLELKAKGFQDENITFLALNMDNQIVASSSKNSQISLNLNNSLKFQAPIQATFDNKKLGYLIALYPIKNLKSYLLKTNDIDFIIKDNNKTLIASNNLPKKNYTTLEFKLNSPQPYTLTYMISNQKIFDFFDLFLLYLIFLLLFGIFLITFVSKKLTKHLTSPILSLTNTAKKIIDTKNYNIFVNIESVDETNELARTFNHLVKTTSNTLKKLEQESNIRVQRFIDLTNMLNHIIQTKDKKSCIDISIQKLNQILPNKLSFNKQPLKTKINIPLMLHDFDTNTKTVYGYLTIDKNEFDDVLQKRFFNSVASMITLQLQQINSIKKIKSISNAKTTFIQNMSHELRTPLNAIIGFSQYLITYETLNDEQLEMISKIEKSAMHLLSLINDILDISKIEAGKIDINYTNIDLIELLKESIELVSALKYEKDLKINLNFDQKSSIIKTDPKLLKQIIINLLSNAIKFTPAGEINITLTSNTKTIQIVIQDSGIGIEKEELKKIFDEFVQLNNPYQTKHKGSGLGLALSKKLADSLNIELTIHSEGKNRGTKAILKLSREF